MIIPTKHELLNKNLIVVGATILKELKKNKKNIDDLFHRVKEIHKVNLDSYLNAVTFLWLAELIELTGIYIELKE